MKKGSGKTKEELLFVKAYAWLLAVSLSGVVGAVLLVQHKEGKADVELPDLPTSIARPFTSMPTHGTPTTKSQNLPGMTNTAIASDRASSNGTYSADRVSGFLEHVKDTSINLENRRHDIWRLAKKGDEKSVEILMAVGNDHSYLSKDAVEALGSIHRPNVAAYLKEKLHHQDAQMVMAAARGLVRSKGEQAIDELSALLSENHQRADNYHVEVCSELVRLMAWVGDRSAVAVLEKELQPCRQKAWDLEYGSVLVAVLGYIGGSRAVRALDNYANCLNASMPLEPLARSYFLDKIAEARAARAGTIDRSQLGDSL